jgi:hypothetical protein
MHIRLLLPVALLIFQAGCGGLGMPLFFDIHQVRFGEGRENVAFATGRSVRGSDPESMTLDSLRLSVVELPEFLLRFPDGFRLSSRNLTAALVIEHVANLGSLSDWTEKGVRYLRWSVHKEVAVLFMLKEDQVVSIYISGPFHCPNVSLDSLSIEWSNGNEMTFPLPYGKLRQSLGKPTSVQSQSAASVWACPR